nr:MAG TPA: head closure knob [Caudoviricetes sp.]
MIDIDYYRKIQNAYGANSLRDSQRNQVKQDLNRDFNNTLDAYTVTIDGIEKDLTILKTNDSHVKKIKSRPNESFNTGQIVYWMDSYWLIKEVDTNNDIITNGKMVECNFVLYWQDSSGNILNRHVYVEDFTKYSNGETGNSTITIGDNQYGVYIQIDEDTKKLKRGMRFAFDFEDSDEPDIYSLTNRKVNLYNYESIQKGGMILLTFSFNAFNANSDKKITLEDGKQVWICNYRSTTPSIPDTPDTPTDETVVSIVGSGTLRIGRTKTWTVEFKNKDENDVAIDGWKWNIKADFDTSELVMQESELSIKITAQDDDSLVDESFLLQILIGDSSVMTEKQIDIVGGY